MSWQQASPDGGPLEPVVWAQVPSNTADLQAAGATQLEARIAKAVRRRRIYDELRAEHRDIEDQITALREDCEGDGLSISDLIGSPLDLPRAARTLVRMIRDRDPGPPPTRRLRQRDQVAHAHQTLADALEHRGRLQVELERTSSAYRDLLEAVTEKARRVIDQRLEGWEVVQDILDGELAEAREDLRTLERGRDQLRGVRLALTDADRKLTRLEDAPSNDTHIGSALDEALAATRLVRDRIEQLRELIASIGGEVTSLRLPRNLELPQYGSPRALGNAASRARSAVRQVSRSVDNLGNLDTLASDSLTRIAEVEDRLIDLMLRPS